MKQCRHARAGGERQAAGNGEIVFRQPPEFADDDGERAALQGLLQGLEQRRGVGGAHEDETGEIESMRGKARAEGEAVLRKGEILDRQQPAQIPRRHEAGGQTEREAESGGRVGGRGRGDLVQPVAREAAAEAPVERARKRQPHPFAGLLDALDHAAQMGNPFGPVARRHPLNPSNVLYLF